MNATERAESFRDAALRYCALIDDSVDPPVEAFLDQVAASLVELHQRALELPSVEPSGDDAPDRMGHEEWNELFMRLGRVLGARDGYWLVHDPTDMEQYEPVFGSLADDLADIYRDLREGLDAWDSSASKDDAIWEWRFSFWSHWGAHLVDSVRTIHFLRRNARMAADAS